MDNEQFDKLVDRRVGKIRKVLSSKGEEYGREDMLHNFKIAGKMLQCSPERALLGMKIKHDVSVADLVNFPKTVTPYLIDEKIGDAINYLVLLEALLKEGLIGENTKR